MSDPIIEYEDPSSSSRNACPNPLCAQFRLQHRLMTQKHNEAQKELDQARKQHTLLYNQVVTRGEHSMVREAATGESSIRLPSGEEMTPEKYMMRTRMMNQCRETLQASEKRAKQLGEDNARLQTENDKLYTRMRTYEDQLNGFERARHYDVFTDELHRVTLAENEKLVDEVERLSKSERELKEGNTLLRRRIRRMQEEERPAMKRTKIDKKRRPGLDSD